MKQGMAYFTDTYLTTIGLLIFFIFFVCMVIWISLKENRDLYKSIEKIPLLDGEYNERR